MSNKNKYLTFTMENELYGLPILSVREIIEMKPFTIVPEMPNYLKGVIDLRENIIPVLDLRIRFGLESKTYDDKTCIIIVEIIKEQGNYLSGLIVERVSDVVNIEEKDIELPLIYENSINYEFLSGIAKSKDKTILLLNTNQIIYRQDTNKILALNKIKE